MVVLFVHGMGRTPLSGWPMLHRLRQAGMKTTSFGYMVTFENFSSIKKRLVARIVDLAETDNYLVIGHSLGGVLLRAALNALPATTSRPRHIFLLGSPIQPSRLAKRLKKNIIYRALAGDCGQLLASSERMSEIGLSKEATTSIVGVRRIALTNRFFGEEQNDGVVAISEVSATWISTQLQVPVTHTWLPSSKRVAEIITAKIATNAG